MDGLQGLAQPGLFVEEAQAGHSLEWSLEGDPAAALAALKALDPAGAVIGIGAPLAAALGRSVPGLRPFSPLEGPASMPATQRALWAFIPEQTAGAAFDRAEELDRQLAGPFSLVETLPLFRYRDGRDLTGYKDGTGNPPPEEQAEVAVIPEGPQAGGSFALVQRYVHFRERFNHLPEAQRDDIIGRRLSDNEEFDEAPETSHVKRTDQEGFDEPAFMLRRSMPWGDLKAHGLLFVAFVADLGVVDLVLRRMCGLLDEVPDSLLKYTQAETGAYYYCPPQKDGRLNLAGLL
ncbi:Dyp-type peroxidase [Telmatospirillum siberiense]|uniref:Peroxidase n=1 Tax=Telmatospirillum siberiense TaxID=382514 RepID=A0A2N3PYZ3_9PROT|nr:Dyp-type peroxidase [Telmatospirillum siberiense]PKU25620.1 peroxidase [Telmatospirillum siberiense]